MPSVGGMKSDSGSTDPNSLWGRLVNWFTPQEELDKAQSVGLTSMVEMNTTSDGSHAPLSVGTGLASQEDSEPKDEPVVDEHGVVVEENFSVEQEDAIYVFRYLLVFNAVLESFSHGANDTANSTAAFAAIINGNDEGLDACDASESQRRVMFLAGAFVLMGIVTVGYRVIETVGKGITAVNYQRGWCIEFASTFSVVLATWLELPVSTTHCQIGAVTFVGLAAFGADKVKWSTLGQIVISWVLTLPFSGLLAAALAAMFREGLR
uniref:Phosphate transporter n=2 Tax=Phaeomonas parva TaxID=124430 RepID=A0A7S1UC45_9STRA|mmetsp:Transcript_3809/g.10982  ORF Transcript_3809/g.10982 Transcript_3809/m.10982 type:complete len:265 (+) Transcript_3809:220-1014(+)